MHDEIHKATKRIADEINKEYKDKEPFFLIILNGAFMFGADLLKHINISCEVSFIRLSSYIGTKSSKEIKETLSIYDDLKNRNIIIVEDIVDTGLTIEYLQKKIKNMGALSIKIVTLLFKENNFRKKIKIDYTGFTIPNVFVVGYGLDYNGYGRNLKDIYFLV